MPVASSPQLPGHPEIEYNEVVVVDEERKLTPSEEAEFKKRYRLGLPLVHRTILGALSGFTVGAILGVSHGAKREGLRFRAENAHRLPTSQKGWYFYHKSKNYVGMLGGLKEGFRMGSKTAIWVVGFIWLEAAADHNRRYGGQQDFLNTTTAGIATAALWSAWNRFPAATTVRTGKLGFKVGLTYGLLQDALGYARGREIAYIEYLKKFFGRKNTDYD
ncbi:uncharacterized protein PV09_00357 [Verruconis gallopava]|uniref:Mitochondrial import inner membrane translocase subunit TIM22 n=1 Tax=Verruconis gallopava TaxID=253628 RepID=A0A0D2AS32_9PEZI|nr:uncharacterized protein PV09_00357 [Verruconis gallopava]KIW09478.1 hypothetical protein PV09_00357 [Verruconis gallopava]